MDKKILILLVTPLLVGCTPKEKVEETQNVYVPEITHHNYFEVDDKTITWEKAFSIEKPDYFIYCYSPTCSHCAEIKDLMIEAALSRNDLFFVKSSEKDKIVLDVSKSIGATTPEQIVILGYPTCIEIRKKILVENKAGKTQIKKLLKLE